MNCEINFFNESISYVIRKKGILRKWISTTIEREGKVGGELNFILCDDAFLSELNYKYLKHKTLTDILTFSFDDENGYLGGDIFISLPRVKENALKFNQRTEDELHRVMIHGVLHLIGYNDSSKQGKMEMRGRENFYLDLLKTESNPPG
jgi:probable rRNA maturation factor